MIRALQFAAAVGCLLVCVAIMWLWHRSYRRSDGMWSGDPYASVYTFEGLVCISFTGNPFRNPIQFSEMWARRSSDSLQSVSEWRWSEIEEPEPPWWEKHSVLGFALLEEPPGRTLIHIPLWAPLALAISLGTALALKWRPRFSVRTALIATTIVAVGVGAIAIRSR